VINVVSSAVTTAVIAWFLTRRLHAWRTRQFDRDDQLMIVALVVLAANALISFSYTKDEIMGPGGVFYAIAAFVAVAHVLGGRKQVASSKGQSSEGGGARSAAVALTMALFIAASGWVVRTAGLHYQMHLMGFYDRNEWVYVDDWLARQKSAPASAEGRALVQQLRSDAIERRTINPYLLSPRLDQWFR
jgi:hypothetical protein